MLQAIASCIIAAASTQRSFECSRPDVLLLVPLVPVLPLLPLSGVVAVICRINAPYHLLEAVPERRRGICVRVLVQ